MKRKKIRETGSPRTNPFHEFNRRNSPPLSPKHASLRSIPFHSFLPLDLPAFHPELRKNKEKENHKGTRENKSLSLAPPLHFP